MRHRYTALFLTLTILLVLVLPRPVYITASTVGSAGDYVVNNHVDKLAYHLRTAPNTAEEYKSGSLAYGEKAKILGVVEGQYVTDFGSQWYKLDINGSEKYLIVDPPNQTITKATPTPTPTVKPTATPIPTSTPVPTATPTPIPNSPYLGKVVEISRTDGLPHNLRTSPDATLNNSIALVYTGTRLAIIGQHSGKVTQANDSLWFSVVYDNQIAYLYIEDANMIIRDATTTATNTFKTAYNNYATANSDVTTWTNTVNSYGNQTTINTLAQAYNERLQKQGWLDQVNAGQNPFADGNPKYYNLFNIMASASTGVIDGARINGIRFAMGLSSTLSDPTAEAARKAKYLLPWDTQEKAANGGAIWINELYVNNLQDSIFYQKFNLKHPKLYYIQYMQAIEAPRSESARIYNAYKITDALTEALTFLIPVYSGMPKYPSYDPANEVDTEAAKEAKYKYDFSLTLEQLLAQEGINITQSANFYQDLKKFPDITYWKPLIDLHKQYPTWRFVAESTRDSWSNILYYQVWENDTRSLIQDLTYNQKYIKDHEVHDGTNWVSANEAAVAYFMDPRNFLNLAQANPSRSENPSYHQGQLFMFLNIYFSDSETIGGIQWMFTANPELHALSTLLYNAAKGAGISAYFLASRMQQEVTDNSNGHNIANNARGTIDIKYPPLVASQDSLTYMTTAERKVALQNYINTKNASANKYTEYLAAVSSLNSAKIKLATSTTALYNAANTLVQSVTNGGGPNPTATPVPTLRGDINGDNAVDEIDKVLIYYHVLGIRTLSGQQLKNADINYDNTVDEIDKVLIYYHVLGIRKLN